jgi:FixJ family two-component response regulator
VNSAEAAGEEDAISSSVLDAQPIVFVIDDDIAVRESLELLLRHVGWQAEMFATAQEFIARPRAETPSCLILDVTLPDLNGLDLQKRISADQACMPIIFITGYGDVPMSVQAMKAGAFEFLTKPLRKDVLLSAIQQAIKRSQIGLTRAAQMRLLRDSHNALTPREQEVMALVVSGLLNKQIAAVLNMSEGTVKAHRARMMRKMEADSLADLVRIAASLGLPIPTRQQRARIDRPPVPPLTFMDDLE